MGALQRAGAGGEGPWAVAGKEVRTEERTNGLYFQRTVPNA
jgi:hypothetical protein